MLTHQPHQWIFYYITLHTAYCLVNKFNKHYELLYNITKQMNLSDFFWCLHSNAICQHFTSSFKKARQIYRRKPISHFHYTDASCRPFI